MPDDVRPARRSLPLAAGCALAFAQFAALAGHAQIPDNRGVKLNPDDPVPPAYRETLDARDFQRLSGARDRGDSYVPVLQGGGRAPLAPPAVRTRPRTLAPAPVGPATRRALPPPAPPVRLRVPEPSYEHVDGLAPHSGGDRLSELLGVLLESWSRVPEIVRVRYPAAADGERAVDAAPETAAAGGRRPDIVAGLGAGRGFYARTMYAVESNVPGPVFVEILEPPLAGAVATGEFSIVRDRLALRLREMRHRGRRYAIDAWGVGPDCACYGIAGEVEPHFLSRVLLPAAVRFAEGFLAAVGRPAQTVHLGDGGVIHERRAATARAAARQGAATALGALGEVLSETAPKGPTIRIPRDSEVIVTLAGPPAPMTGRTPREEARDDGK